MYVHYQLPATFPASSNLPNFQFVNLCKETQQCIPVWGWKKNISKETTNSFQRFVWQFNIQTYLGCYNHSDNKDLFNKILHCYRAMAFQTNILLLALVLATICFDSFSEIKTVNWWYAVLPTHNIKYEDRIKKF